MGRMALRTSTRSDDQSGTLSRQGANGSRHEIETMARTGRSVMSANDAMPCVSDVSCPERGYLWTLRAELRQQGQSESAGLSVSLGPRLAHDTETVQSLLRTSVKPSSSGSTQSSGRCLTTSRPSLCA